MFLQKTYNILMQEDSYFSKVNIHIIQCDAEIQEDVGEGAFDSCCNLKKIIIPATVEHIGDGAFAECTTLEKIVIPDKPKFGAGDWFKREDEDASQIPQNLLMELTVLEPFMDNNAFSRSFNKPSMWDKLTFERQADAYLHRHTVKLMKKFKKFINPEDSDAIAKEMILMLKNKTSAKERNAVRDFLTDYYPYISEQSFIILYEKLDNISRFAIMEELEKGNDSRLQKILIEKGELSLQINSEQNSVKENGTSIIDESDFLKMTKENRKKIESNGFLISKGILKEYTGDDTEITIPPEVED